MKFNRRNGLSRIARSVVETLEERALFAVSGVEQEFVYLLNRARSNPQAYAAEVGLGNLLNNVAARGPLAVNANLMDSADVRSGEMSSYNYFAHQSPVSGLWPNKIARNAGYALPASFQIGQYTYPIADSSNQIESIAAGYSTAASALRGLIEDAGVAGAGHRVHLMGTDEFNSYNREIGVGYSYNASTTYDHYWTAHATRRNQTDNYVTGVVYNDVDGDEKFDAGEGIPGVMVVVGAGYAAFTNEAGGYTARVPAGTYGVQVIGAAAGTTGRPNITIAGDNVEVDFIANGATYVSFEKYGNARPTLDAASPTLPLVSYNHPNPPWTRVSAMLGNTFHDANTGTLPGIALTGYTGAGTWQVWMDGNANWVNVSNVSDASALLVRDVDWVRFLPAAGFSGTATLTYRGWDRSDGKGVLERADTAAGGSSGAYSAQTQTASATVSGANSAPVLNPAPDRIVASAPTGTPTVSTVGALLASGVSDPDAGAVKGMAVTGYNPAGDGKWQFQLQGGAWQDFPAISTSAALQLRAQDSIRFVPTAGWTGNASLIFRAWDQTTGAAGTTVNLGNVAWYGGTTAYSQDVDLIDHTVTSAAAVQKATISVGDLTVTEGDAGMAVQVPVTRAGNTNLAFTLNVALAAVDSSIAGEFSTTMTTLSFAAGETTKYVIVNLTGDVKDEANERFSVTVSGGGSDVEIIDGTGVVTVLDNDPMPGVTLSTSGSMSEAGGTATVTATLSAISGLEVRLPLTFLGTATVNGDYSRSTAEIVIPAGSLSGGVTLTGIDDGTPEAMETVIVRITGGQNATVAAGGQQVTVNVIDNDPPPTVVLSTGAASIGESGGTTTVTATLAYASSMEARLPLTFLGTAALNTDYLRSAAEIVIPAGSLAGSITLTGKDDAIHEGTETIVVRATTGTNVTVAAGGQEATVNVLDNEAPPSASLSSNVSSFNEAGGTATLTVALSHASSMEVRLPLTFLGTATANSDYSRSTAEIVIPAGSLSGTVTLAGIDDAALEGSETAIVRVNGGPELAFTILDDEVPPARSPGVSGTSTLEDVTSTSGLVITPNALDGGNVTSYRIVNIVGGTLALRQGGAAVGENAVITAAQGAGGLNFTPALNFNGQASFQVIANTAGGASSPVTVTIGVAAVNDAPVLDTAGTPGLTEVVANTANPAGTLVSSLLGSSMSDVDAAAAQGIAVIGGDGAHGTWEYSIDGGANWGSLNTSSAAAARLLRATDLVRFVPAAAFVGSATVSFVAWDRSTGTAGATADASTRGGASAFSAAAESAAVQVVAEPAPVLPVVTVADASVVEGNSGVSMLQFAVTLSEPAEADVTVPYVLSGITATAGTDFDDGTGVVVIAAGQTSAYLTVDVMGDRAYEPAETLSVTLGAPVGATLGAATEAVGTIMNDDARPMPEIRAFGMVLSKYVEYQDGKATMNFGSTKVGSAGVVRTFKVNNAGTGVLYLTKLVVPAGFVVTDPMAALLLPGQSDVIKVKMLANAAGAKGGLMRIHTTDADERIFDITLSGTVKASPAKAAAKTSMLMLAPASFFSTKRIEAAVEL